MCRWFLALPLLTTLAGDALAQEDAPAPPEVTVIVKAGKYDRHNTPVAVSLLVPEKTADANAVVFQIRGSTNKLVSQLTAPALARRKSGDGPKDGWVRRELHFVIPDLAAGRTVVLEGTLRPTNLRAGAAVLNWGPVKGSSYPSLREVALGAEVDVTLRRVLSYVNSPYDASTAETRNKTYKVFHHLYDPTGTRLVTNGGHTDELPPGAKMLYPHHRGLYFGFNKVAYGDGTKKADVWHCQKDDHISHEKELSREQGSVLGRHRVLLDWHGAGKEVFAQEEREVGAYNIAGGTLVEWSTRVKATGGPVMLDGDPQHAGFHFRAANEVAEKTEKETYFLRPDGKGKPNETRNWPEKKDHVNLPWNAMCFKLGDKRYTVVYMDHPSNPRETRHSERAYGRIGCYFQHELTKEKPLQLTYRIWLQEGEMSGDAAARLHRDFSEPPTVEVKVK